ncbi:PREDICTED: uncharacterized protein LOC106120822 isoform X2 [Papilio xuthus]|uniref:Uncharacterized protein LOC106120822 isoform X2 n=1 Tax=Papilio xuthus TaxID=66420 RepID=A0AAJ6ZFS0_PAPXU|nr:PREDICTED: uncharacterized protein LOC106120822 isoform X2 [Papilio xuthus]
MSYEFKGDLENISQRQKEFISEVLRKQNYTGTEVIVENIGKKGDNYGSQVKRIKVIFDNGKEFRMIAKILPDSMKVENQMNSYDIFTNEAILFNEVLPKFKEMQLKYDLPEEEIFKYPICYGTLMERMNETILLEDLVMSNFTMLDKTKPLYNETVKLVLKDVAKFHAMSYVLRNQEPQMLDKLLQSLVNPMFDPKNMAQSQNLMTPWLKLFLCDKGSKYSVIQHGDLWTNNIMFQIQNNQPASCVFLDYQMSRDSLPVSDIHNFIFNCTDYETRSKHYHEWMDYYHSELDRYLNYFGLKANYIYPRDKLDADLNRYGKVYLGISFFVLNITLREAQEAGTLVIEDNEDGTEQIPMFKMGTLMETTKEAIKCRIEGLIDSCFDLGYMNKNLLSIEPLN